MTVITCKISDKLFQGFEVYIDLNYIDTVDEICKQVHSTLITHLETYKFESLLNKAKNIHFHIHDYDMGQILMMGENAIIWICNH
jgi:acyl-CoA synthetase (NDP forming)|tara:strand:- start:227 stop:481 length:255 start_codon:yes stop_codon:yes gene_type:complete